MTDYDPSFFSAQGDDIETQLLLQALMNKGKEKSPFDSLGNAGAKQIMGLGGNSGGIGNAALGSEGVGGLSGLLGTEGGMYAGGAGGSSFAGAYPASGLLGSFGSGGSGASLGGLGAGAIAAAPWLAAAAGAGEAISGAVNSNGDPRSIEESLNFGRTNPLAQQGLWGASVFGGDKATGQWLGSTGVDPITAGLISRIAKLF